MKIPRNRSVDKLMNMAIQSAIADDCRSHRIGAIAVRQDGAIVHARNGASKYPHPELHAEQRLLQKAGHGAIVFVARVTKLGEISMARPCIRCQRALVHQLVKAVFFTTYDKNIDVMYLN